MTSATSAYNKLLTHSFRDRGVTVRRALRDRPYRIMWRDSTEIRILVRATPERPFLEFTCTEEELHDPVLCGWLAAVYCARRDGLEPPPPPVPVTGHWKVYGAARCTYLWSLAALDAHAKHSSIVGLEGYDPRKFAQRA